MRFAWAVVGSTWLHMGLVTLFLVRCASDHDAEPIVERPVTLVVAEFEARDPAKEGEPESSEARDGDAADATADADADEPLQPISADELAALDPGDILAMPPEAFGLLDPTLLGELDAAQLEALRELEIPDDLRVALLAALEAAELEAQSREVPDLRELAAADADVPAVVDAAADPERTTDAEADAAGADGTGPDDEDPTADPEDAVADAALPLDPELARDEDPDKEEEFDVEVPEPEEERTEDPRWQKFLHADDAADEKTPGADTEYISSRDSRTEEATRTEVVAEVDGPLSMPISGVPIQAGSPALSLADGDPDGQAGDLPSAGEPVDAAHEMRRGGGALGEAEGAGAPDRGGETRGGPVARSGRRAAPALPAIVVNGGAPGRDGSPEAPRGEREAAARSAAWWAPSVVRVVIPAPVTPPAEAAVSTPMHTEATHAAPAPRPDDRADEGGTEQAVDEDEPIPDEREPDDNPEEGEADEEIEVPEQHESVSDLRAALGWGGVDRQRTRPRRTLPGTESSDGNLPTSPKVSDDELDLARFAVVDAKDTPLGRYRAAINEEIDASWHQMDLSVHERALGIQGDVTVVFHVQHNGRVSDATIVRRSGHASLDQMALDAIPDRLPRFPKDIEQDAIYHLYTFHYRNQLIVREPAQ